MTEKEDNGKLLACPFCGGEAEMVKVNYNRRVQCDNEGCVVKPKTFLLKEQDAVKAWNRRVDDRLDNGKLDPSRFRDDHSRD